jgi:hypothetical protein
MKAIVPIVSDEATLVIFGSDQPEQYFPLPAAVYSNGTVMTEWELSAEDLARALNGGRIRLWLLHTGILRGRKLTPLAIEVVEGNDAITDALQKVGTEP